MMVGLAMAGKQKSGIRLIVLKRTAGYRSMQVWRITLARSTPHILYRSAHPTSGGPYFWAAMLSEPENAALASWITGS